MTRQTYWPTWGIRATWSSEIIGITSLHNHLDLQQLPPLHLTGHQSHSCTLSQPQYTCTGTDLWLTYSLNLNPTIYLKAFLMYRNLPWLRISCLGQNSSISSPLIDHLRNIVTNHKTAFFVFDQSELLKFPRTDNIRHQTDILQIESLVGPILRIGSDKNKMCSALEQAKELDSNMNFICVFWL